jgi:hypothetical protein
VAPHYLSHQSRIRWSPGCSRSDCSHLAEELRTKNARRDHCQHRDIGFVPIVEAMNYSAWYAKRVTGTNIMRSARNCESQHALEPIDCLLIAIVAMRNRNLRSRRHVEFKHRRRASRLAALKQKPDFDLSQLYLFTFAHPRLLSLECRNRMSTTPNHFPILAGFFSSGFGTGGTGLAGVSLPIT